MCSGKIYCATKQKMNESCQILFRHVMMIKINKNVYFINYKIKKCLIRILHYYINTIKN